MADPILSSLKQILSKRPTVPLKGPNCTPAAVLLLVYQKEHGHYINLQKRTQHVQYHKGEVCLPGGTPETGDASLLGTALREAEEEIGIQPSDVTILGQLDDVVTRTGYTVTVFVGTIPHPYSFNTNDAEVEEVLEVPLTVLLDSANLREEVHWEPNNITTGYSYAYGQHLIYGATAKIIDQFLQLIEPALQNRGS